MNSTGLPGGLPVPPGGGTLAIARTTLMDGIQGRTYTIWIPTTGGSGTLASCSIITGSLPAGLSITISADPSNTISPTTAVTFCKISGTITTVGPATVSFTVQAADSAANTASQSLSIFVRSDFTITPSVFPNGVIGRTYGNPAEVPTKTPQPVVTTLSAAAGNAPLTACVFTMAGNPGFNLTPTSVPAVPTNTALTTACPFSSNSFPNAVGSAPSVANLLTASGPFSATLAATDSDLMDTLSGQTTKIVVPRATKTSAAMALTVNPALSVALAGGSPDPTTLAGQAVSGRTYGAPAKADVVYTVSGGLPTPGYTITTSGTLVTATNITCVPSPAAAGSQLTTACSSSGSIVTNTGGTTPSLTVRADDNGNAAVPASTASAPPPTVPTPGLLTQTYTVNPAISFFLTIAGLGTITNGVIPDGVVSRTYGTPLADLVFTATGGFANAAGFGLTGTASGTFTGAGGVNCTPTTAQVGVSVSVTCNSGGAAVTLAAGAKTLVMTFSDVGNLTTPAGSTSTDTSGFSSYTNTLNPLLAASFAQGANTNPNSTLLEGAAGRSYGVIGGAPTWSATGGLGAGAAGATAYQWCVSVGGAQVTAIGLSGISTNCLAPTTGTPVSLTSASAIAGAASFSVQVTDTGNTTTPSASITQGTTVINILAALLVATFNQNGNTNANSTLLDGVNGQSYGIITAGAGAPTWSVTGGLGSGTAGVANYGWCIPAPGGAAVAAIGLAGIAACPTLTSGVASVQLTSASAIAGSATFSVDVTDAGNLAVPALTISQGPSTINILASLSASFNQAGNTNAASTLLDGVNGKSYGVINANAGAPTYTGVGGLGSGTAGAAAYQWCISVNPGQVTAIGLSGISTVCGTPTTGSPVLLSSASAITGSAIYTVQLTDTGNAATPVSSVAAGPSTINILAALSGSFAQGPNTNPNSTLLDGAAGRSYGTIGGAPTWSATGGLGSGTAGATAYQWCISVNPGQVTAIGLSGVSTVCGTPTTGTPVSLTSASAIAGTASFSVQLEDTGNAATPVSTVTQGTSVINILAALAATFNQNGNTNANSTLLDGVNGQSYGTINAGAGAPTWTVVGGLGAGTAGVANYSWCISSGGPAVVLIGLSGITTCPAPTAGVSSVQLTSASAVTGTAAFAVDVTDAGNLAVPALTITQGTSTINIQATLSASFVQGVVTPNTNPNSTLLDGVNGRSYGVITANAGAPTYTGVGGLGAGTAGAAAYQWCISVNPAQVTAIGLSGISTVCGTPTTGSPVRLTSPSAVTGAASYTVQLQDTGNAATPVSTVTQGTSAINILAALGVTLNPGSPDPTTASGQAVVGRTYGSPSVPAVPAKANVVYLASNGLTTGYTFGFSNTLTTNTNISCTGNTPTASTASCNSGGAAVTNSGGTTPSLTVTVDDAANEATPSSAAVGGATGSLTQIYTVNPAVTLTVTPDPALASSTAVVGRLYGAPAGGGLLSPTYTAAGGLTLYVFAKSGTLETNTNIICTVASPTVACESGVVVTGTAPFPETEPFTLQVTDGGNLTTPADAVGVTLTKNFTINDVLAITTASLTNGLVNYTYVPTGPGITLAATGGLGGNTWVAGSTVGACTPTGSLPTGLTLGAATGLLSGVPTVASTLTTDFTFDVCVFDTANVTTPSGTGTHANYLVNVMNTLAAAADSGNATISVFNTTSNASPATSIALVAGDVPFAVAVTPDGRKTYVTVSNVGGDAVRVVDTISGAVSSIVFASCAGPQGITMGMPGGVPTAFVACSNRRIAIIDAATDTVLSENLRGTAGANFYGAAITPNDALVYVTDAANDELVVLNAVTGLEILGSPFALPVTVTVPHGVVVSADGLRVYIAGSTSDNVVVLSTADNTTVVAGPISTGLGSSPESLARTPDILGAHVYVTLTGTDQFAVFDDTLATPAVAPARSIDPTAGVGAVRAANVVTITTTAAHGFAPAQEVVVAGVAASSFNGAFVIIATPTATTFTYAQVAANATSQGGTAGPVESLALASGPFGVTIPPIDPLLLPLTGYRVYIGQLTGNNVAIRNDEFVTPFSVNGAIALTPPATPFPMGLAHIPVPR